MSKFSPLLRRVARGVSAALVGAALATSAHAGKLIPQNLTALIGQSDAIVVGTVRDVRDGIENGVPFTEVKIQVGTQLKGNAAEDGTYTFRQFGLLAPKKLGNGKVYLAVTPEGFAQWHKGENVMAFFNPLVSSTGLQSTVGLAQGKLSTQNGKLANEFGNTGLFEGVEIDASKITPAEQNMLTGEGAADREVLMGLVQRAVQENWIESGVMR